MTIEGFTKKFAKQLDQKDTRRLINERARQRLQLSAYSLLKYLVTCAWGSGKKRLVTVSIQAMERGAGLSDRRVRYSLSKLTEHGLISKTEDGYAVHCEPMQEWPTRKEAKAAKVKEDREQARLRMAAYRARKAGETAMLHAEAEIHAIIKQAEREGTK